MPRAKLIFVAAAHLTVAMTSMKVAIDRRSPFHLPVLHGDPERVGRDSFVMGTALSEPVVMMVAEAGAICVLVGRPSPAAVATLGCLGAVNLPGYVLEQHVRLRLRPSGWDNLETPLVVAGIGLAAAMAKLALRDSLSVSSA